MGRPAARGPAAGPAVQVLDRCRIRAGEVVAVDGEQVEVVVPAAGLGRPAAPVEGAPVAERARWSVGGSSLIECPLVGDAVALHWDWVCDVVSVEQARRLVDLQLATLRGIGLPPSSAPASVDQPADVRRLAGVLRGVVEHAHQPGGRASPAGPSARRRPAS